MNTSGFLLELALIIRGEHRAWEGDRIQNAELFCHRVASDFDEAVAIANDIERNLADCADFCGISQTGLRWSIARIREHLPNA